MNLPWDKSYFKLSFYIIFTFIVIYLFKWGVDIIMWGIMNMGGIYRAIIKGGRAVISVFSVIITGFVAAYILNPVVDFFIKHRLKRGIAVAITFVILVGVLAVLVFLMIQNITDFGKYSIKDGIEIYAEAFFENTERVKALLNKFNINLPTFKTDMVKWGKYIAQLFLGLVISIYFLKDKEKIIFNLKNYSRLLPNKLKSFLDYLLSRLNYAFSGYIRGQLTDAIIMASIISLALSIINIPFAIPIGILSGILNIIPYFGAILAFVLSVGSAVLSGNITKAVYAAIVVFIIQQIDGIFISPKILGDSVRLSPVVVIIALAVSANIFGVWGMILAVPVLSFVKLVLGDVISSKNMD